MHFSRRMRGDKIATVIRQNLYDPSRVNRAVHLVKGRHLICECGGEAMYRPAHTTPGTLGYTCRHIEALYCIERVDRTIGPAILTDLRVSFTARGHQLFDSIWAAHMLMKE
jgi:hypothetical protein